MDSILFCSAGRRGTLIKNAKKTLNNTYRIIATDCSRTAPAIYFADAYYIVPRIDDENYLSEILKICKKENVKAITTLIDPEIEILARNRDTFDKEGIIVLTPEYRTASLCFDKFKMYEYLIECGINTIRTFDGIEDFDIAYRKRDIEFPVFIKPRTGSGSVGIEKITDYETLKNRFDNLKFNYIIQEFMDCEDCDADVYIDTITHKAVSAFSKKKIETRIGGASKTISFKDDRLFEFIKQIVKHFKFYGPVDMDFFYRDGDYYLSEINPRFGGAYIHAYGAGVDFFKLLASNIEGIENKDCFGRYEENIVMLMYDEVVIKKMEIFL